MNTPSLRQLLRSKATFAVMVVAVGFLSFSLTTIILRHWRLRAQIDALEAQAETLQQSSFKTKALIDYLSSRSFNEQEARLKLNLLSPNEKVAVIVGQPEAKADEPARNTKSNLRQWLEYFFGSPQ